MKKLSFKNFSKAMLLSVLLAAGSCNLNQEPFNAIPDSGAIKDATTLHGATLGMYSALQSADYYGGEFIYMNSFLGDDAAHTGTFPTNAQFYVNNVLADNITMGNIWGSIYNTIYRANAVITRTPSLSDDKVAPDDKAMYIAEAKFVRALCFFDLARLWGNVPLPVDDDVFKNAKLGQTPQAQVYDKIIADLKDIEDVLPASHDSQVETRSRATTGAAKALLARVYLYAKRYPEAASKAKEVLDLGYALDSDYTNVFTAGGSSNEHIFSVYFDVNDRNSLAFYFYPAPAGRREIGPSSDLLSALSTTDKRRTAIIARVAGQTIGNKYNDINTGTDQPTVLRAAEMVLIRAEALAMDAAPGSSQFTEAVTLLNAVRTRAGIPTVNPTSKEEFLEELLAERMREFCFEPHRFTDLTRTGKADEILSFVKGEDSWSSTDALLPIPLNELLRNENLVQNPGY